MAAYLKKTWQFITRSLSHKRTRRVVYAVIVILSLAFIAYAFVTHWNELKEQEWKIDYIYILLAVALYPAGMIPTAAGWHWLLRSLGVRHSFGVDLRLYALSSLPRHIPGFVTFVASRAMLYQERGVSASLAAAATGAETGLLALTGFTVAMMLLGLRAPLPESLAGLRLLVVLAGVGLILLLGFTPALNRLLRKALGQHNIAENVKLGRKELAISLVWMLVAWCGGGLLVFLLARAVLPVNWGLLPVMVGAWGAAGAVSLTIGIGIQGMGIREVTLGALLSTVLPPLAAFTVAVAFRLVLTAGEFIWVAMIAWITRGAPRLAGGR